MQPLQSPALSNHRTGPPPISPSKRKLSMDQGDEELDCENDHVSKMSRMFNPHLGNSAEMDPMWVDPGVNGFHMDEFWCEWVPYGWILVWMNPTVDWSHCGWTLCGRVTEAQKIPRSKPANGDFRKEHRERSRSPIERAAAPTMSLHANHMYASIPSLSMEQPLALTKNSVDAARTVGISASLSSVERQQNRPSVITCASANNRNCNLSHCPIAHSACSGAAYRRPSSSTTACDPVVEEHFRRSLGKNYKEPEPVANSVSITGSVDDHFAKALGDTWLQIKAAKDGVGSSPEPASRRGQASPSSHMVNHNHSPSVVS
ncbi:vestigial like family member 4 [Turdus rufiventris]|nr:vestigial like family member 4 [Turdus rufiventris]